MVLPNFRIIMINSVEKKPITFHVQYNLCNFFQGMRKITLIAEVFWLL